MPALLIILWLSYVLATVAVDGIYAARGQDSPRWRRRLERARRRAEAAGTAAPSSPPRYMGGDYLKDVRSAFWLDRRDRLAARRDIRPADWAARPGPMTSAVKDAVNVVRPVKGAARPGADTSDPAGAADGPLITCDNCGQRLINLPPATWKPEWGDAPEWSHQGREPFCPALGANGEPWRPGPSRSTPTEPAADKGAAAKGAATAPAGAASSTQAPTAAAGPTEASASLADLFLNPQPRDYDHDYNPLVDPDPNDLILRLPDKPRADENSTNQGTGDQNMFSIIEVRNHETSIAALDNAYDIAAQMDDLVQQLDMLAKGLTDQNKHILEYFQSKQVNSDVLGAVGTLADSFNSEQVQIDNARLDAAKAAITNAKDLLNEMFGEHAAAVATDLGGDASHLNS